MNTFLNIDKDKIDTLNKAYTESVNAPFAHCIFDGLLTDDFAHKCKDDFLEASKEAGRFVHYADPDFEFEKYTINKTDMMPESLRILFEKLHSPEFVRVIEQITGIQKLHVDEGRWGGGLHMTRPSGYLAVHRDFSVLPTSFKDRKQFLRTINIIGYLLPEWQESWGGDLELWNEEGTECVKKVAPTFNRWVIFDTRGTYHGHPLPYKGIYPRISIAAYYYQELEVDRSMWRSTEYLRLPWKEESSEYRQKRLDRANAELRYARIIQDSNK